MNAHFSISGLCQVLSWCMVGGHKVTLVAERAVARRGAWTAFALLSTAGYLSDMSRSGALLRAAQTACLSMYARRTAEDGRAGRQWLHLAVACLVALALLHACGPVPAPLFLHVFGDDGVSSRVALVAMDALLGVLCASFLLPALQPAPLP
jgi:hypothetical protein